MSQTSDKNETDHDTSRNIEFRHAFDGEAGEEGEEEEFNC